MWGFQKNIVVFKNLGFSLWTGEMNLFKDFTKCFKWKSVSPVSWFIFNVVNWFIWFKTKYKS